MQVNTDWIRDASNGFGDIATMLWWLAITFFGVCDVLTTSAAVLYVPVGEGSPIVGYLLRSHGLAGLVALKMLAFGIAYAVWRFVGEPDNVGVPLALSVLGIGFTTWNLFVLAATFS